MTPEATYDQLVQRAQQAPDQERQAIFDELIVRFEQAGLKWAYELLHEREAAEDALQEASLTAFLHLDQLQDAKAFPSWFRQIVVHTCHRMMRRERTQFPLTADLDRLPDPHDGHDDIENEEQRESVNEAVLRLPERERVVTQLFYFDDLSQDEIAVTLDVPITTVKKRLQYARERLRGLIDKDIIAMLPGYLYAINVGCTAEAFRTLMGPDNYSADYVPDLIVEIADSFDAEIWSGLILAH